MIDCRLTGKMPVPQRMTGKMPVPQKKCRICGGKTSVRPVLEERAGEEWPELQDGTLCELCWRGARDVFRVGRCMTCGTERMCKAVLGGLLCVRCYVDQPVLERYGRCPCGRLELLQIADRVGRRYLCLRCQDAETMSAIRTGRG